MLKDIIPPTTFIYNYKLYLCYMASPIYILHILSNTHDFFQQKTFSMCINEFIDGYVGHYECGRFIPDEMDGDVIYHREFLESGHWPPVMIVDVIAWMQSCGIWSEWMGSFDRIAILKQYVDMGDE